MPVEEIVIWLNSPEGIALASTCGILGGLGVIFPLFRSIVRRLRKREAVVKAPKPSLEETQPAPKTWWEYLTGDLDLTPKLRKICAGLYDTGWEQLNRPTNNREGTIENGRRSLQELSKALTREEIESADELGKRLADQRGDQTDKIKSLIGKLSPAAQSYARMLSSIREIEHDKTTDLAQGIPLTDYREVKASLKANVPLVDILDQLPLAWQMIRTIHDPIPRRRPLAKVPKLTRIRLTVLTDDEVKVDNRAELDEDWVISDKLGMATPFTGLIPWYEHREAGRPPIIVDRRMVVAGPQPPGTDSRFWTQGGYTDKILKRAARGEDPRILRRETLKKRVQHASVVLSGMFLTATIIYSAVARLG